MLPMVVPIWAPAELLLCQGDPGPSTVQLPKGVIPVYVTSLLGGNLLFRDYLWDLSTHCNIAEMRISRASTLQLLYNQLSSDCL